MKNKRSKMPLLAVLFALVMMLAIGASAAFAEEGDGSVEVEKPVLEGDTFFAKDPTAALSIQHLNPDTAMVHSVKSSNPKVLAVKKDINEDYGYKIIPKKKGTAKLKVSCSKDGEKYTLKATYKVKAYPNVIESLKVNGKKLKVTVKKNAYKTPEMTFSDGVATVQLTKKDDWNIDYVYALMWNSEGGGDQVEIPVSTIEDGSEISIPEEYTHADIEINISKSTGPSFFYQIHLKR